MCVCVCVCVDAGDVEQHQILAMAEGASTTCKTYTVKSGDICYDIANDNGISLSDLLSYNPGIDCDNLQIGQTLCISEPTSDETPTSPDSPTSGSGSTNGKLFREYIGAEFNDVAFSDVPINDGVEFHYILSFAIDYNADGSQSTNGNFNVFWDDQKLTPDAVLAIKSQHKNVKVMVSLGGDTVNGNFAQFQPTTVSTWVSNAVSSLTNLVQKYHLDGIDIDYEHFDMSSEATFSTCIGQLITQLKQDGVISSASIAPFDGVESFYKALWNDHSSIIDYVNFQFYTYDTTTSASQYVTYYKTAAAKYAGGNVLASFSTEGNVGPSPSTVLDACQQLKSSGLLPGIFVFSADDSFVSSAKFQYEQDAQSLLAS